VLYKSREKGGFLMKKRVKWIKSVSWCLILIMLAAALAACTTAEFEQLNKLEEQLRASASLGETTGTSSVETETSSETPTYIVCPPSGIHGRLAF
jgi:cytoskeletal protein RodZ